MKKLVTGLLASALLVNSLPAFADRWDRERHFRPDRHYAPPAVRHRHSRHNHEPIVWGLAGLAIGAVLYNIANQPVVAAPVVVPPQPQTGQGVWHYCEPYRAYYPNVQACPEPWRTVPAW
jgi:hypothetical protein